MAKPGKKHPTAAAKIDIRPAGLMDAIGVVKGLGLAGSPPLQEPALREERIPFDACPLCQGPNLVDSVKGNCSAHPLYRRPLSGAMQWKRCVDCTHIFTEGFYSEEACKLIYGRTNEHQQVGFDFERQRLISSHMVEKILPYADAGNWLDVGFGNGSLLFTAQEYGFTPVGLDLRSDNVAKLSALGVESHCADLTEWTYPAQCSVISMADVLEHMPYPQRALQAAHRLLSEGGVLFVSMPNTESMAWKMLDQQHANPYWGEIEHYHNFSRSRLYALLQEYGFEPVRYGISERYRVCMEVIARRM